MVVEVVGEAEEEVVVTINKGSVAAEATEEVGVVMMAHNINNVELRLRTNKEMEEKILWTY